LYCSLRCPPVKVWQRFLLKIPKFIYKFVPI
jgi:hypothetical protein